MAKGTHSRKSSTAASGTSKARSASNAASKPPPQTPPATQATVPATTQTPKTAPSTKPIELSIALPYNPGSRIHLHLTLLETSILLFLATAAIDAGSQTGGGPGAAMGAFVYAMPDKYNPTTPLSTPLYTSTSSPSSLDFHTRLAKLLARRTGKLCYVGGVLDLSGSAAGGSVEEEMGGLRAVVEVVLGEVEKRKSAAGGR